MNFKTYPPRCISSTLQIAHIDHRCWRCPHPIDPGEYYKRDVWLTINPELEKARVIAIYKEHEECPGDRYEDEEEKERGSGREAEATPGLSHAA